MPSIVHLGLGNFHRAHQAKYTHDANAGAAEPWRITGVAMSNPAIRDAMAGDGWAYDLGIMAPEGLRVERIAVHDDVIVATEAPERVIDALAAPKVAAVTLTITEKGYALTPDGALDLSHPGIAADIAEGAGRTAIALLARGLTRRTARGGGPVTVLSCDNLSGNGARLRRAVADFLAAIGTTGDILRDVRFPDTMVDRITPATTADIAARMAEAAGRPVLAPVLTEAFSEWVIGDPGEAPLPDWERAGAVFVPDVGPYERRKLLCLNAAHSALAYGGLLRGHTCVHEAVSDPVLKHQIRALWAEAAPLLPAFAPADLGAYTDALTHRFAVAGMAHRLSQIAMDGSVKLPQRILPILRHHGHAAPAAARVLGDWWRVLEGRARHGEALDDPMEATLKADLLSPGTEAERLLRSLARLGLHTGDLPEHFADLALAPTPGP